MTTAKIVGFGKTGFSDKSPTLKVAEMSLISENDCKSFALDNQPFQYICGKSPKSQACSGDSGGK